jgi:hypothetical protein
MKNVSIFILMWALFIPLSFSQTRIGGNVNNFEPTDEEVERFLKKQTKFIIDVQNGMNDCKKTSGITFKGLEELQMRLSVEIMDLSSYQEDCGGNPMLKESKLIQCFQKDKHIKKSLKDLIASPDQFINNTKRMYLTDGKRAGDLLLFLQNLHKTIEVKE